MWSWFFKPPAPPWVSPREVLANDPAHEFLMRRLVSLGPPPDRTEPVLEVFRDRETGQAWECVIAEDGPVPLYALQPRAAATDWPS